MICKKCGCDTFINDGDMLVCAQCGAVTIDMGIDLNKSITNQINEIEIEAGTESNGVQAPPPIEKVIAEQQAKVEAETKKEENTAEPETEAEEITEEDKGKKKKPKDKKREIIEFCIPIVIAAVLAAIIKLFILANAVVPTGSMIPTINEKDRIIASRLAYISNDPERYDIILFRFPDNEETIFVKRILGFPGETINVRDGKVYITEANGKEFAAEDSFVNSAEKPTGTSGPFYIPQQGEQITTDGSYCYAANGANVGSTSFLSKYCEEKDGEYYVKENLYFCIGDNINTSMDSRVWANKYVSQSKIIGKAIFKYYPNFEKFE
ncbi:MAG: signal peptidase I [Eubacterium sp.]|nr:signal peptidase I [Eubacterium sp.]MDE6413013.1 signal peptidase I [Eubacterium sp.]